MVMIAGFMPYALREYAELLSGDAYEQANPRTSLGSRGGRAGRAYAAHLNGLEIFPLFAVSVIISHLIIGPNPPLDILAVSFIVTRLCHSVFYILDMPRARSISFSLGGFCIAGNIALTVIQ
jgi:uncharacterized MAPEG superfamily protein